MTRDAKAILIVHLTDLHILNGSSPAVSRLQHIAGAIGSRVEEPTVIVVAVTGDLAFSGTSTEYEVVRAALNEFIKALGAWSPVEIVVVSAPGNHDCDFKAMPEIVRTSLLESLEKKPKDSTSLLEALEPTQAAFYKFSEIIGAGRLERINSLVSQCRVNLPNLRFNFVTLNTAITSRKNESPGSLHLPATELPSLDGEVDFCVVLAHHPLNWFTPEDAVSISEWMDRVADLTLWGHEHRSDEFVQVRERTGSTVRYEIGLPLDDGLAEVEGFKFTLINAETREASNFSCEIKSGKCKVIDGHPYSLTRNENRSHGLIRFSDSFKKFLNDPGATFTHPRISRDVQLSDLFVPPDFREHKTDKVDSERTDGTVSLEELCKHAASVSTKTIVYGAEQAGKTTFAKYLSEWMRNHQLIPIYLDGNTLRSISKGEIRGWFNSAVRQQFQDDVQDAVVATPPDQLVAILDNVHAIRGGQEGVERVLEFVGAKCRRMTLLTADNPALSLLAASTAGDEATYWKGGDVFELLPLGHKRRAELIRRWVSLGRDLVEDGPQIEGEVRQVKAFLDRLLGRDSLPKYPLFVLVILQQMEGMRENRTAVANGSHGYLFEALISQAIDKFVRSHQISTVTDCLAAIAYEIWKRDAIGLSEAAFDSIIQSFLRKFVSIDGVRLLEELDHARILFREGGLLKFRYNYVYFYYLAKWICAKQNVQESELVLDELVRLVHTELSSNVLMFVAHLQNEDRVISRLIPFIDGLYIEQRDKLKTLEGYSALLLRFRTAEQRATLLEGSARAVSDAYHDQQDKLSDGSHSGKDADEIEDGLKFNATLKAIHTLGQVLKSRASGVEPDAKMDIARSVMGVSKRLMGFLYDLTEANAENLVRAASDAFEEAFKLDRQQAVDVANALVATIVLGIAHICVTRAAEAIGSTELIPLLDQLRSDMDGDDSQLTLLVARIIGEREYPKEAVEDFITGLKPANVLPRAVLAHTVARRFYLDPPDRAVRDSACKLLGINVKRVIEPRTMSRA